MDTNLIYSLIIMLWIVGAAYILHRLEELFGFVRRYEARHDRRKSIAMDMEDEFRSIMKEIDQEQNVKKLMAIGERISSYDAKYMYEKRCGAYVMEMRVAAVRRAQAVINRLNEEVAAAN